MHGTVVEVRKNPRSITWYTATILDAKDDHILVGFEDNIWPSRVVPSLSVRRCPSEHSSDDFEPQVDEFVEVSVAASEANPSGWALGRVKSIRNSFYFIAFESNVGPPEIILERPALRRVNAEPAIDASQLARLQVWVDPELHDWILSEDCRGCLSHVQTKGRLLVARCDSAGTDPFASGQGDTANGNTDPASGTGGEPHVLLVGTANAVTLGEKLLTQIHFRNQMQIQRFFFFREKMLERLTEQQHWYSGIQMQTFTVEQPLVGRIIGKKGENIKLVRERHNVEINVKDVDDGTGRFSAHITVSGQSAEAVQAAREDLEYVTVFVPVEEEQIGWILGRGYQNIQEVAKKTELHYARFDSKTRSLELCGLQRQVDDAKMLISVHREYLPVYKDMDQEQHAIDQSFEDLDQGLGKGRKGKSKGARGGKGDEGKDYGGGIKGADDGGGARKGKGKGPGGNIKGADDDDGGRKGKGEKGKGYGDDIKGADDGGGTRKGKGDKGNYGDDIKGADDGGGTRKGKGDKGNYGDDIKGADDGGGTRKGKGGKKGGDNWKGAAEGNKGRAGAKGGGKAADQEDGWYNDEASYPSLQSGRGVRGARRGGK
eukprot:TRINITY_DN1103_c0_g1_i1.p1 TRINITY_DN1103_c0_g1~~TRINITY_DN1103_c0_g1_i1.p1  ORF type:complete len:601 (-),score=138.12 TRINITY_DN1103_c0_g1_i1:77-1879(-)